MRSFGRSFEPFPPNDTIPHSPTRQGGTAERSRWYEQQRDGLGHALIDEFEERLALALEHPHAGTVVGSTTQGQPIRRHRLAGFARYSILMFVNENGTATVLAFSHSSRNPVHWKDRIR